MTESDHQRRTDSDFPKNETQRLLGCRAHVRDLSPLDDGEREPHTEVSNILLTWWSALVSRFQAQTNAVLDRQLDELSRWLGLRGNQRADLLREVTDLAAWVVRQTAEGRVVEARGEDGTRRLDHPVLEQIRNLGRNTASPTPSLTLTDEETRQLAGILDRGFDPTPGLLAALRNITAPERRAPDLNWSKREG